MSEVASITSVRQITGKRVYYRDSYSDKAAYSRASASKAKLLLHNPFWGFMGLDLVLVEVPHNVIGTLCTDGYHIFYSAKFINSLRPGEVEFAVAHEIYHCLFGHTGGEGKINRRLDDWDPTLWNRACDYVINYDLSESGVGDFITTVKILYDKKFAGWSSEEVYEYLKQNQDPQPDADTLDTHIEFDIVPDSDDSEFSEGDQEQEGGGDQEGDTESGEDGEKETSGDSGDLNQGRQGEGQTIRIKISQSQANEEKERWEKTAQRAVAHVENSSQSAGSIPAHLRRLISDIGKPKIDWRAALRKFVVNVRKSGYSFVRPDKRTFGGGMTIPGFRRDDKKLEIAVAFDTSGSVSDEQLGKFIQEFLGIMKSYRSYVVHAFCFEGDVDEATYMRITGDDRSAETNLKKYAEKVSGGGGTRFQSVWDFLREKKIKPRGLAFFTDGYPCDQTWHKERMYCPTIFITVGNRNGWKAPFGLTVRYEDMG